MGLRPFVQEFSAYFYTVSVFNRKNNQKLPGPVGGFPLFGNSNNNSRDSLGIDLVVAA